MRVTSSVLVAKPAERVFMLSQDYERRLAWDNYLSEAHLLGGAKVAAVGVESHCKSRGGSVMVSKYIAYSPPSHAAVEMVQGPWIFSRFGGTWRFREVSGATEVQFIYNFKVRPGWLRWLLEPIIGALYRRDMQRRVEAFKTWAENEA